MIGIRFPVVALCFGLLGLFASFNSYAFKPALNQLGFLPYGSKVIVVPNVEAAAFYLVDESNKTELLRGPLTQPLLWQASGQTVKVADLSAFNQSGTYRVRIPGLGDSPTFVIAENRYDPLLATVAQTFYWQRAGVPIVFTKDSDRARPSLFADLLVSTEVASSSGGKRYRAVPGGWLNGQDFGKSVIANSTALAGLLHAYLDAPAVFDNLSLPIPGATKGKADLLLEARWALDWLQTMQDDDGGVFHSVATRGNGAITRLDADGRSLMPKSTAATLHFTAIMALAAKVSALAPEVLAPAADYEQAALNAWQWALMHPKTLYRQPAGYSGATYAQVNETLEDEWFWAAAELATLTHKKPGFKTVVVPKSVSDIGWQQTELWGLYALAESSHTPKALKEAALKLLTEASYKSAQMLWQSGYMVPMEAGDFSENANGRALTRAMLLLKTNRYTPNKEYEPAARALLDYLLGRNPMEQSYVTGFGNTQPKAPVHTLANWQKTVLPGFVVAGPNKDATDRCLRPIKAPAMAYMNDPCSPTTNTITLERQGLLLYVLSQLRKARLEDF